MSAPVGASRQWQIALRLLAAGALLVVLGSVALSLRTTERLAESVASVSHTQRALEQINRLWGVLGDRDSNILRYLLTGNPDNLEEFWRTLGEMEGATAQLRELLGDNPAQRARIDRLDALHQERITRAREVIGVKQRALDGDMQAQAQLDAEFGQSSQSRNAELMRDLLERMAAHEKALLAERRDQRTQMIEQNRRIVLSANGLALAAGVVVLLAVRRLRRRADEAERARRADREQSELLAVQQRLARERQQGLDLIAHDLRQHLGNILFSLDLLPAADTPEARGKLVQTARGAANGGLLFLRAVLEQGANEARGEDIGPLELATEVALAVQAHAERARAKGMRFELRLDPELRVRAQASGLGRVLGNLLSNAVKYGPEGGVIEVEAQQGPDRAVLCVLDRGPGVPAAEQPALFRRYARLSPQPSGGEEATGLGLALARQHARAQGADLRYEDRPGGGACFRLEWPLA